MGACRAEQQECDLSVSIAPVQSWTTQKTLSQADSRTANRNSRTPPSQPVLCPAGRVQLFHSGRNRVCLSSRAFFYWCASTFCLPVGLHQPSTPTHSSSSHAVWNDAPNIRLMRQCFPCNRQAKTSQKILRATLNFLNFANIPWGARVIIIVL